MSGDRDRQLAEKFEALLRRLNEGGDPEEEMRAIQRFALEGLTPAEREEVKKNFVEKDLWRRFEALTEMLDELVQGEKRLITGGTLKERAAQYEDLVRHVRDLWRDAVSMFERERFATATFLAIACMEEVGKGGVARWQLFWQPRPATGEEAEPTRRTRGRRSALYSHRQKHLLVVGQGALINARIDHLLGFDRIKQFVDDVEAGEVERLRQAALYADHDGEKPLFPDDRITRGDALFYVILAGELMAEVLGVVPETWRILLDEVKAFENANGVRRD